MIYLENLRGFFFFLIILNCLSNKYMFENEKSGK